MKNGAVVQSITQGKSEKAAQAILNGVGQKRDMEATDIMRYRDIEIMPTDANQKRVRAPDVNSNAKPKPQAVAKKVRRAIIEESSDEEIELESDWSESESAYNENEEI